jgi:DNA polymerase
MKEIHACRPWLEAELDTVRPELIVCLGAVEAQSLLGSGFKITQSHGKVQEAEGSANHCDPTSIGGTARPD